MSTSKGTKGDVTLEEGRAAPQSVAISHEEFTELKASFATVTRGTKSIFWGAFASGVLLSASWFVVREMALGYRPPSTQTWFVIAVASLWGAFVVMKSYRTATMLTRWSGADPDAKDGK